MGIEYEGNQGSKGIPNTTAYITAEEYIKKEANVKSNILKQKLFKEGIKNKKCEICGLDYWLN